MIRFLFAFVLWGFSCSLWAQPTIQDCLGAISVCQSVYTEDQSPSGQGNILNEIPPGITCIDGDNNSIWYVFNASEDGFVGFLITPNDLDDDYDWALFNLTGLSCDDLTRENVVSCNAAGGFGCHGPTGATSTGSGTIARGGCFNNSPLNSLVPTQAGETFVLVVSNWTGSRNGYTIDFSESSGLGVVDETPPFIERAYDFPGSCGETTIEVEFHEFIQCNTVFGNDFQLRGPGGPYTLSVISDDCNIGSEQSKDFTLTIDPPIASLGDFELILEPAAADHILDLCGNQALREVVPFVVETPLNLEVDLGQDTSLLCADEVLTLDASALGIAWQWDDGSTEATRTVDSAGLYTVFVTTSCGVGRDTVEVIEVQVPTVDLGADEITCPGEEIFLDVDNGPLASYEWQDGSTGPNLTVMQTGLYAVTVTNVCGAVTDEVEITYVPPLNLGLADEYAVCDGDTLVIDVERPFATYNWSDGSVAGSRLFTESGNYGITVSTPCEAYEADFEVLILVDPQLELGPDTILCLSDTLVLDADILGSEYLWQDGQTTRTYTVTQPGTYSVSVNTSCNEFFDSIRVEYLLPITTDLGQDTFLCPEDPFILDATTVVEATYQWEDNSKEPVRPIIGPGVFAVTVTSQCEQVQDTLTITECEKCPIYIPNAFSPNRDGINDTFMPLGACPLNEYEFVVYDRWGSQVFSTTDPNTGWDGRTRGQLAASGAYVYFVRYLVVENNIPRMSESSGEVVLLR